jgi:hypothetical protein
LLAVGGFLIAKLLAALGPWFERHISVFRIVFACIGAMVVLSGVFKLVHDLVLVYRDRAHLLEATSSTALTRASIATDFNRFQTKWGRARYTKWLRDTQVKPLGNWPEARPNVDSDTGSTMLAQLDERWLGIEG